MVILLSWQIFAASTKPEPRSPIRLALDTAQTVHAGQFAPGIDGQVVQFAKPARGRYFSLDTFSSQDGQPYAAVGELDLIDETGQAISHSGWTVAYADSEEQEKENGSAENAMDGLATTFWHTQWSGASPNFPHRLILDLGRSRSISGFRYVPRQGSPGVGGRIKNYCVKVGDHLDREKPPIDLLPEQCFLFSHFTDNDHDGLHLLWSLDGFRWQDVNRGRSVFKPMEDSAKLLRDPCLLQGPDGVFHLVWTCAWTGKTIGHATSRDLIQWSEPVAIPVMSDEPAALNCWAPEIFWDAKRAEYLIVWSSTVTNHFLETLAVSENKSNDRLYCTTTKDFQTFTPTRLFYDPGFPIIDATVLSANGRFYLFFKDDRAPPFKKDLRMA
ncbi:MAG: discoidin domain-containing protein, partial [Armatimonadetes bacterium]|nr:discoidin domain-containing protein [Akkermansiaceae bacterium]